MNYRSRRDGIDRAPFEVMNAFLKTFLAMKPRTIAIAVGLLFATFGTTQTQATPIIGGQIFVQHTGDVVVTFTGSNGLPSPGMTPDT